MALKFNILFSKLPSNGLAYRCSSSERAARAALCGVDLGADPPLHAISTAAREAREHWVRHRASLGPAVLRPARVVSAAHAPRRHVEESGGAERRAPHYVIELDVLLHLQRDLRKVRLQDCADLAQHDLRVGVAPRAYHERCHVHAWRE